MQFSLAILVVLPALTLAFPTPQDPALAPAPPAPVFDTSASSKTAAFDPYSLPGRVAEYCNHYALTIPLPYIYTVDMANAANEQLRLSWSSTCGAAELTIDGCKAGFWTALEQDGVATGIDGDACKQYNSEIKVKPAL